MNINRLDDYIIFNESVSDGPEAGYGEDAEVYKCFAELYEPSQKDVQLGNLETVKQSVTAIIRDACPQFRPSVRNTFTIQTGLYKGMHFNIKHVAPAKVNGYIKVVGEAQ